MLMGKDRTGKHSVEAQLDKVDIKPSYGGVLSGDCP